MARLPFHAYDRLPTAALVGKTVIDTMNYFPPRHGRIATLDDGELASSALVQRHLADSRVVKACNNLLHTILLTLARPDGAPDRTALPIAGDDPAAKAQVAELLNALNYDTVDVGTLADIWRFEPGSPVYTQPYLPGQPPPGASLEQYRRWATQTPYVPVPAARVRELIDSAVRSPAGDIRLISTPN